MARRENCLIRQVTLIYSLSSIIAMPIWFVILSSTDFIHPLKDVIGEWFCTSVWLLLFFHFNIIAFQSFNVALMRYVFIVHDEKVKTYGKEKAIKNFLFMYCIIPLVVVIWGVLENYELDPFLYVNRCYGRDHRVFLANTSPTVNSYICGEEMVGHYEGDSVYGQYLTVLKRASCMSRGLVMIFMGCNISEGILYYKMFSHMRRYSILYINQGLHGNRCKSEVVYVCTCYSS